MDVTDECFSIESDEGASTWADDDLLRIDASIKSGGLVFVAYVSCD